MIASQQRSVTLDAPTEIRVAPSPEPPSQTASTANAPPALLANWRWRLALWQIADRDEFQATMQKAHAALLVQNPELKKGQD